MSFRRKVVDFGKNCPLIYLRPCFVKIIVNVTLNSQCCEHDACFNFQMKFNEFRLCLSGCCNQVLVIF